MRIWLYFSLKLIIKLKKLNLDYEKKLYDSCSSVRHVQFSWRTHSDVAIFINVRIFSCQVHVTATNLLESFNSSFALYSFFTMALSSDFFVTKEPVLKAKKFSRKFLVGLPLSRGGSNRVRSTSRGGRSPSAPSKTGAGATGAPGAPGAPALVNGAPGRGRRSRSVSKVGIKLGAYTGDSCVDALFFFLNGQWLICGAYVFFLFIFGVTMWFLWPLLWLWNFGRTLICLRAFFITATFVHRKLILNT